MLKKIALLIAVMLVMGMAAGCARKTAPETETQTGGTGEADSLSGVEEQAVDEELGMDELDTIDQELGNLDW